MIPSMKKKISQEAFEDVVRENIYDFGMEASEALQDAIHSLSLQGVDLSGIITCVPGESSVDDNPVVKALQDLKIQSANFDMQQLSALLLKLSNLCDPNNSTDSNSNAAIASRNGGVELLTSICSKLSDISCNDELIVSSLSPLIFLFQVQDVQSAETFHKCGGPDIIIRILNHHPHNSHLLNACFSVIAASATCNEILKESFISLKVGDSLLNTLKAHSKATLPSLYDAIRILLTPDDCRVAASQDEICRSIADNGGIDAVLQCIDDSVEQLNKSVARPCCSLLLKLAGSDHNKSAIVEEGGLDRLIMLAARFEDEPSVIHEVMYIISVLSLRSPDNASRAMEAGAGDLAIEAMQKFPDAQQLQRNACLMIRNLVARNLENRKILLGNGIEKLIRKSKVIHENCKAAATDALRDLGLDNYNL